MWREAIDYLNRNQVYPWLTTGDAKHDREIAHERAISMLETIDNSPALLAMTNKIMPYCDPILESEVFGLRFRNPVGLAAGFDKNAKVFRAVGALGFGAVEVGTITKKPYQGQRRPRIFHLPKDYGYINRMGFPGEGTDVVRNQLIGKFMPSYQREFVLGGNIGASAISFKDGTEIEDYAAAAKEIDRLVDYITINISSPNTEGVRDMISRLYELLSAIGFTYKPKLIKFSPDISAKQLRDGIETSKKYGVKGYIMGNTSTNPEIRSRLLSSNRDEPGGISGYPIREKALERVKEATEIAGDDYPVIAVGGLRTARDYWNAFSIGKARLGQSYTGFVEPTTATPNFAAKINRNLASAMRAYGMRNLDELRGSRQRYPFLS